MACGMANKAVIPTTSANLLISHLQVRTIGHTDAWSFMQDTDDTAATAYVDATAQIKKPPSKPPGGF